MGFMDRMKQGMEQAQEMAKQAGDLSGGTGMDTDQQAEMRNRVVKLNNSGVNQPATVKSLTETGNTDVGGGKEIAFAVQVRPEGGDAYEATFTQFMVASVMEGVSEGSEITVRVDPDDPNAMLFWGLAS